MTDHTNTYPDLVNVEDWLNAKGYTGEAGACHQAMSLIRKQEKRIADLRKEADMMHSEYKTARARIAELEVPLCIGRRTIGIMAEEGMWQSEDGRAVVAADELFRQDPYARIAELEAEVADLNECLTLAHMDGFEKGRDAARAALEKKE
jgi:hypothetical protein